MGQNVQFEADGPIAVLTLASPGNENRLNGETLAELDAALSRIEGDQRLRVLILRAEGSVFSNGMDLGALGESTGGRLPGGAENTAERNTSEVSDVREAIGSYSRILFRIANGRIPVICALNAPVRAGGVGLVAACDIVIAGPDASVELSEVRFGLLPANVLPYLLGWRMAPQRARYLVLTARRLSPLEAFQFGVVDELAPSSGELEKAVKSAVKSLLRSSPAALALSKQYTSAWAGVTREAAIEQAVALLESLVNSTEVQKDLSAFASGELPDWFVSHKPSIRLTTLQGDNE